MFTRLRNFWEDFSINLYRIFSWIFIRNSSERSSTTNANSNINTEENSAVTPSHPSLSTRSIVNSLPESTTNLEIFHTKKLPERQSRGAWHKLQASSTRIYSLKSNTIYFYQTSPYSYEMIAKNNDDKLITARIRPGVFSKYFQAFDHFIRTHFFEETPVAKEAKDALFDLAAREGVPFEFPSSPVKELQQLISEIKPNLPPEYKSRLLHVFVNIGFQFGSSKDEDLRSIANYKDATWRNNCINELKNYFSTAAIPPRLRLDMLARVAQLKDCCNKLQDADYVPPPLPVVKNNHKVNINTTFSKPLSRIEEIKSILTTLQHLIPVKENMFHIFIECGLSLGSKKEEDIKNINLFKDGNWRKNWIEEIKIYFQKKDPHRSESIVNKLTQLSHCCDTHFQQEKVAPKTALSI